MKIDLGDLRVSKEDAVLVLIDFQEKLMPAMAEKEFLTDRVRRLAEGATVFGIPKLVTEQYPKGLGRTIEPVKAALGQFDAIEKSSFSTMDCPEFEERLAALGKKTVLLCGIETHICVMQTAFDLIEAGYKVVLVEDACSSRSLRDGESAISRMAIAGCIVVSAETVLMEMLASSKAVEFKQISNIIK